MAKGQVLLLAAAVGVAHAATHPGTFKRVGPSATCSPIYLPGYPVTAGATSLADAEIFCVLHDQCGGVLFTEKTNAAVFCDQDSIKFSPLKSSEKCRMDQACAYLRKAKSRSELDKWTSICSHVHCQSVSHVTKVIHSSKEEYGSHHICKHGMHEAGFCGCECFDESAGDDFIFDLTDSQGDPQSSELRGQLTESAALLVKRNPRYSFAVSKTAVDENGKLVCAEDMTECPDGTLVGRNHKNLCEHFECPTPRSFVKTTITLEEDPSLFTSEQESQLKVGIAEALNVDVEDVVIELVNNERRRLISSFQIYVSIRTQTAQADTVRQAIEQPQFRTSVATKASIAVSKFQLSVPFKYRPPRCERIKKKCPDGSIVGPDNFRRCEFPTCPTNDRPTKCKVGSDKFGCSEGATCQFSELLQTFVCTSGQTSEGQCPEGCSSYFDGCNTCSCDQKTGLIAACTKKFCAAKELPHCNDETNATPRPTPQVTNPPPPTPASTIVPAPTPVSSSSRACCQPTPAGKRAGFDCSGAARNTETTCADAKGKSKGMCAFEAECVGCCSTISNQFLSLNKQMDFCCGSVCCKTPKGPLYP